ncbi:hypothetical protein [Aeoliella sp.]|uniref:hypothetical protein n=1 Tax=Aeoliella sp. TaxID=2795800 RepID=UPI003CCB99A2
MEEDTVPPTRRPRFSLLTLVLVTTIVALAVAVFLQYQELGPLREENRRLRYEVGELDVEDASQVHVVSVKKAGGYHWQWRIHLPKGHDWWIHLSRHAPKQGLPEKASSLARLGTGGEVTLIAEVLPAENGVRYLYLRSDGINSPFLEVEDTDWLNGRTMIGTSITGEEKQIASDVDEPLALLRLESDKRGKPSDYDEGLLIWLSNSR